MSRDPVLGQHLYFSVIIVALDIVGIYVVPAEEYSRRINPRSQRPRLRKFLRFFEMAAHEPVEDRANDGDGAEPPGQSRGYVKVAPVSQPRHSRRHLDQVYLLFYTVDRAYRPPVRDPMRTLERNHLGGPVDAPAPSCLELYESFLSCRTDLFAGGCDHVEHELPRGLDPKFPSPQSHPGVTRSSVHVSRGLCRRDAER